MCVHYLSFARCHSRSHSEIQSCLAATIILDNAILDFDLATSRIARQDSSGFAFQWRESNSNLESLTRLEYLF